MMIQNQGNSNFIPFLEKALVSRQFLFDSNHREAFRLYNGFSEGNPQLVIDLYGSTLLIHNYAENVINGLPLAQEAQHFLLNRYPWLRAGILKNRNERSQQERRGQLLFGDKPDSRIKEHDVWYAVDLAMNRDASFYLDTRHLRKWLIDRMDGKTVLNTFAYTGSLGVAAQAGGASRVVQLDLSRPFLNLAKESYTLNGFPIHKGDFMAADFFPAVSRLRHTGQTFDCVLIDPPFFSTTSKGNVDQVHESARLINKVRPLVRDGGLLVAINNALFVSGKEYMQTLEDLCKDGYLELHDLIPVPQDFIGFQPVNAPVTDPTPFNHSTKIAVLKIKKREL
jgi:23S rRNA (cytosine1962-C5)-methyltransferase